MSMAYESDIELLDKPIAVTELVKIAKHIGSQDARHRIAIIGSVELSTLRQNAQLATLRPKDEPPNEFTEEDRISAMFDPALPLMVNAIATRTNRRHDYGASEQKFADVMMALFPNGFHAQRRQDWVRFGILTQIVSKLCRYTNNPYQGHVDSIHDVGPYAHMLEAEDRRDQGLAPFERPPNPEETK